MSFYALALLCPFAAKTFAAVVQGKWSVSSRLIVVCSFPLGALWLRPEPAWVGVLVAVAAGLQLAWPQLPWLAVAVGGLTAGLWGGILTRSGTRDAASLDGGRQFSRGVSRSLGTPT